MRISSWSSNVCSSDLLVIAGFAHVLLGQEFHRQTHSEHFRARNQEIARILGAARPPRSACPLLCPSISPTSPLDCWATGVSLFNPTSMGGTNACPVLPKHRARGVCLIPGSISQAPEPDCRNAAIARPISLNVTEDRSDECCGGKVV